MSERFTFSSTKYGPSVISGRTTHPVALLVVPAVPTAATCEAATGELAAVAASAPRVAGPGGWAALPGAVVGAVTVVAVALSERAPAHPASSPPAETPKAANPPRRVSIRPTGKSSLSIPHCLHLCRPAADRKIASVRRRLLRSMAALSVTPARRK